MAELQLLVREGCSLCDRFEGQLEAHPLRAHFSLERVVINPLPELQARYGDQVPLLLDGGEEICHYHLDGEALSRWYSQSA